MIEVKCPRCSKALFVPEQDVGITGICTKCGGHICILEPLEPVPQSEAPPASLIADTTHVEWRDQLSKIRSSGDGQFADLDFQRRCLQEILINLNQLVHLYRYKRDEIPKEKDFLPERTQRAKWLEKMGNFGFAMIDSNIQRRLDNVRDALRGLTTAEYEALHRVLYQGFRRPEFYPTNQVAKIIAAVKSKISEIDAQRVENHS